MISTVQVSFRRAAHSRRSTTVLCGLLLCSLVMDPARAEDEQPLVLGPGERLEHQLSADERHEFRFTLSADRFVYLTVEQLGIDVIVQVFDPAGEMLDQVDGSGAEGLEPVTFFNQVEGDHRVVVVPFDAEAKPGKYVVELVRVDEAASAPEGKVGQLMTLWDRLDSPGAAIAVARDGETIYEAGFGSAQLEYEIPITPTTVFHVASVSKQFTAFAVALLAARGELSLDDDVREHIPEVPDFGKTITLRHLIHHTSGLRDQWNLLALGGWRLDDVITLEHVLTLVEHQQELNFDPGEEFVYCNTGYTLLAEVVARVSGQSFRDWTAENLFQPLGMTQTHFHDDHEMIVPNRAYSYAPEPEGFRKSVLSYANVGATSLFTTVEDLAKWADNLDTAELGGDSVNRQVHERGVLNDGEELPYAFGLGHGEHRGLAIVAHSGGDAGFRSRLVRYPDQRFSVAVLSNLGNFNPGGIARQVAEIYLAPEMEAAEEQADEVAEATEEEETTGAFSVDPGTLDDYVGDFKLDSGLVISVTREGGRLQGAAAGQPPVVLHPLSEDIFEIRELGARVTFEREGSGPVSRFTLLQGAQESVGERVEPAELTAEAMRQFEGNYYSPELGTFYAIVLEEEKLIARHRRRGKIGLTPTSGDEFVGDAWYFGEVRFERDDEGQVATMLVSSGRVRDVRFERMKD